MDKALEKIREYANRYRRTAPHWRDKDQGYWFQRLMQECGELGGALAGDHEGPPEHEIAQIGSIAVNWLRTFYGRE